MKSVRIPTLDNAYLLALKAGAASALALSLGLLIENKDVISAVFVAILCCSPTVLLGLRRAAAQMSSSAIGGLWGSLILLAFELTPLAHWAPKFQLLLGIPTGVTLAIFSAYLLRYPSGYPIAAFSAFFVLLVQFGTPVETFFTRIMAIAMGAFSGFIINFIFSSFTYRRIYKRRLQVAERVTYKLGIQAAIDGPRVVEPGFRLLAQLQSEIKLALDELKLRRSQKTHRWLELYSNRIERLLLYLHLIFDLDFLIKQHHLDENEIKRFLNRLLYNQKQCQQIVNALPEPVQPTANRLVNLVSRQKL